MLILLLGSAALQVETQGQKGFPLLSLEIIYWLQSSSNQRVSGSHILTMETENACLFLILSFFKLQQSNFFLFWMKQTCMLIHVHKKQSFVHSLLHAWLPVSLSSYFWNICLSLKTENQYSAVPEMDSCSDISAPSPTHGTALQPLHPWASSSIILPSVSGISTSGSGSRYIRKELIKSQQVLLLCKRKSAIHALKQEQKEITESVNKHMVN